MEISKELQNFLSYINGFRGETTDSLCHKVGLITNAKSKNALLAKKIGEAYQGPSYYQALCERNNLLIKTVTLNAAGFPKEAMSFPKFEYQEIVQEQWESSTLRKLLSKLFLFAVFQKQGDHSVFLGAFPWLMPKHDLEGEVKAVWVKTVEIIISGNIVVSDKKKTVLAFPRESETTICHVRPHGKNALDLSKLPSIETNTNYIGLPAYSFWLNHQYVYDIIQKNQLFLK